jgi:DNA repair protein RecO (recombination protein O)
MASRSASYQTKAIVIGRVNFGEADRVVRFLTPEHGKLAAVAKGVRRIKSRFGGHLELFGEVNLMLTKGRNLDTITSARLIWYPNQVVGNYDRLGLAFLIAGAVEKLTEPDHPAAALYGMVREALGALDAGADGTVFELWFKLRLLETLGYRPELGGCMHCGQNSPNSAYFFSAERGGIVCASDAKPLDSPITAIQIKFWRLLCDYPYVTISHIADATTLAETTLALCDAFYEHHLGSQFRPTLTGEAA